jgi:hypothetical protein
MFLFFGWGRKVKLMGQTLMHNCGRCGKQSVWSISQQYRYFSLFFVPVVRWETEWLHLCPVCSHGEKVTPQQAQQLLSGHPPTVTAAPLARPAPATSASLVGPSLVALAPDWLDTVWAPTERIRATKTPFESKTLADGTCIERYHLTNRFGSKHLKVETYADGTRRASYLYDGKLHHQDGPALIESDADGTHFAAHYITGKRHSSEGPAYVERHSDGTRIEKFYQNGRLHRVDGPAVIKAGADGTHIEKFYCRGELWRVNAPAYIETRADGTRIEKFYRKGLLDRVDGPAVIEAGADGGRNEEWYRRDKLHRKEGAATITTEADGSRIERDYQNGVLGTTREFAAAEEAPGTEPGS